MFERIDFEDEELIYRNKMYLSVPIEKEGNIGINLTIKNPTPRKIFNRINKFYGSEIDKTLKERYHIKGEIWMDVLGDKTSGFIIHRALDIFELKID